MIYLIFFRHYTHCLENGGNVDKDLALIYKRLFLESGTSRHISVFISGAGHVGTSWCALSLAHALNLKKNKILLIDGNGNFFNISSYLLLHNPLYLEEYIKGRKTLNQLITAYKNSNFHILTAQAGGNYLSEQPLGRVHIFSEDLNILAKSYDHTIIDLGTDITEKNLSLCQIADNVIIMCSEKSADLVKTFDTIKFITQTGITANFNLIINKVNSFEDGYKIYKELCKAAERSGFNCPNLLGIIRIDTRIRDTIRNKELLLTRYPSSEAAVDISNIAKRLVLENDYE